MKKILTIFIIIFIFVSPAYADKLLKSGFINKKIKILGNQKIENPENKIVIIYNHGQNKHDAPLKNECAWLNNLNNSASLIGKKIKDKEIMVYNFCTNHFAGDDYKRIWNKKKFKPPYKGVSKLEKRLNANLDLIEKFTQIGVPKNQIFITGHSCGGWMTMMFLARHSNKVGGGISYMQACYGKLTKQTKVEKIGIEKALKKFRKKEGDGPADLRKSQIDEILKSKNLPALVFTHPKDPYDGLLSDWVEDIPGVERIIISNDKKVNGKKCYRSGVNNGKPWKNEIKNYHYINWADCFQFYNPKILKFIESKI